jgi:hypothetical protein
MGSSFTSVEPRSDQRKAQCEDQKREHRAEENFVCAIDAWSGTDLASRARWGWSPD